MPFFVKTELFCRPYHEMKPYLDAHRLWVHRLRAEGVVLCSGYMVDGQDLPGGGGMLLMQATDYSAAQALIHQDPMLLSGGVRWTLQRWCPVVGDLGVI